MSDTQNDGRSDRHRTGDNADGERIIDAEVEPLSKRRSFPRGLRIAILVALAIVVSVGVALVYQLASTGRLDDLIAGRSIAPAPSTLPVPAPATEPPTTTPAPPSPPGAPAASSPADRPSADPALAQRIEELDERLGALAASIERLQQLPAAPNADQTKLAEIDQALADLRANDAAQAEARASQRAALEQQIIELQARLETVQSKLDASETDRQAALQAAIRVPLLQVLAWSELRDKAQRGVSFVDEAARLAEGRQGELAQAAAKLQTFADKVPPSNMQLAMRFATVAERQRDKPATADAAEAATQSWWQRALGKLAGLVSVRRAGEVDSTTPDGKLAVAATALQSGDLKAAVTALDGLDAVPALAEWREQAERRLALDAALADYGAALQNHLAQP